MSSRRESRSSSSYALGGLPAVLMKNGEKRYYVDDDEVANGCKASSLASRHRTVSGGILFGERSITMAASNTASANNNKLNSFGSGSRCSCIALLREEGVPMFVDPKQIDRLKLVLKDLRDFEKDGKKLKRVAKVSRPSTRGVVRTETTPKKKKRERNSTNDKKSKEKKRQRCSSASNATEDQDAEKKRDKSKRRRSKRLEECSKSAKKEDTGSQRRSSRSRAADFNSNPNDETFSSSEREKKHTVSKNAKRPRIASMDGMSVLEMGMDISEAFNDGRMRNHDRDFDVNSAESMAEAAARANVNAAMYVNGGREAVNLLEPVLDSVSFDGNASNACSFEFYTGVDMRRRPRLLNRIVAITKQNMDAMYNTTPGWRWSNKRKRKELQHHAMRFVVARPLKRDAATRGGSVTGDDDCALFAAASEDESSSFDSRPSSRTGSVAGTELTEKSAKIMQDTGDDVAGFVAFRLTSERAVELLYVHELQVVRAYQGRKLGTFLVKTVEKIAESTGMKLLMLTVLNTNELARKFYRSKGFIVDEASPDMCYSLDPSRSPYRILSNVLDKSICTYVCPESDCSVSFRYADSLQQHRCELHGEPWPFPCTVEGCGRGVVNEWQLSRHMRMHQVIPEPKEDTSYWPQMNDKIRLVDEGGRIGYVIRKTGAFFTVRLECPGKPQYVNRRRHCMELVKRVAPSDEPEDPSSFAATEEDIAAPPRLSTPPVSWNRKKAVPSAQKSSALKSWEAASALDRQSKELALKLQMEERRTSRRLRR